MNTCWDEALSLCRNLWQRTARGNCCTSATSARGPAASRSTYCGGGVGMPKGSAWRWKGLVTSNWKISLRRRVSCSSLITVRARPRPGERNLVTSRGDEWFSGRQWPFACLSPGEGGVDGDGDITRPENITAFRNFVQESTERRGLHILMADGVRLFLRTLNRGECFCEPLLSSSNRTLGHIFLLLLSGSWTEMTSFARVFLLKARKTSRRSWANSCCSVSSSRPFRPSGQVCVYMCMDGWVACSYMHLIVIPQWVLRDQAVAAVPACTSHIL